MASLKSLAKGSFILLISNIVLKAINFILLPLYTKFLSPADYGIVDLGLTASSLFIALFSLCLDSGFFTFFYDKDTDKYRKQVFNSTFFMTAIVAFIPVIGLLFAKDISMLLYGRDETTVISLILISISSSLLTLIPVAQIKIENKMNIFGVINVLIGLTSTVTNIYLVTILKLGYISLVLTNTLVALIQFLSYFFLIRKNVSIKHFKPQVLKKILIYTVPLIPVTISGWILDLSDRYFINTYYSSFDTGLYAVANKIVIMITVFLGAFQTAYPSFVFSNANAEDGKEKDRFVQVFDIFMLLFLVVAVTISVFSKQIIVIMTTPDYFNAYKMVPFLVFGQVAFGMSFVVGAGISIMKKSRYSMRISWIAAIINIVLNYIFIPKYGAIVAAITTAISFVVLASLNYYYAQKVYKCNYKFKRAMIMFGITIALSVSLIDVKFLYKIFLIIPIYGVIIFVYRESLYPVIDMVKSKIGGKK